MPDEHEAGGIASDFLLRTAADLVRIPSINPALGNHGTGESEIARYTENVMSEMGLEVHRLESKPGRPSVVGILRGRGGPSLMFNAHYDTVGVEGMDDPFAGVVENGRLHGRGAYDMKGALAACITAVKALQQADEPPWGDVLVAAVADEETESWGMKEVLQYFRPAHAVVTEPSELRICTAHKGFVWVDLETRGQAAHGSRPDLGVDANLAMGRVLQRVADLAVGLGKRPPHALVGPPSIHCGRLAGGEGPSTYAATCRAWLERRTLPGETAPAVLEELAEIVGDAADLEVVLVREPFEARRGSAITAALERVVTRDLGIPTTSVGTGPWTDAALLASSGTDTVVFGPRGGGAHATKEWVESDSLAALARVLARLPGELEAMNPVR